jgi:hypothetical protein
LSATPFDPPGYHDAVDAAVAAISEPYARMSGQTRAEFLAEYPHLTAVRALDAAALVLGPTARQALARLDEFSWDTADPVWLDGWRTAVLALRTYIRTGQAQAAEPLNTSRLHLLPPDPCCDDSTLGQHYHCARCARVCSMVGHATEQECENAR